MILVRWGFWSGGTNIPRDIGPEDQYPQESDQINWYDTREFGPGTEVFV